MSYNPTDLVSKQIPFGMSNFSLDGKLMYYDKVNFTQRAFISTAEILGYFPLNSIFRNGRFEILLNTGGTLSNGVITGGVESIWWFSGGTADINLIQKYYTTKQVDDLIDGAGADVTVGSGLRKDDTNKIILGLDVTTITTTKKGILTENLYLLLGDVTDPTGYSILGITDSGIQSNAKQQFIASAGNTVGTSVNYSRIQLDNRSAVFGLRGANISGDIGLQLNCNTDDKWITIVNNENQSLTFAWDNNNHDLSTIILIDAAGIGITEAEDYSANKKPFSYVTKIMLEAASSLQVVTDDNKNETTNSIKINPQGTGHTVEFGTVEDGDNATFGIRHIGNSSLNADITFTGGGTIVLKDPRSLDNYTITLDSQFTNKKYVDSMSTLQKVTDGGNNGTTNNIIVKRASGGGANTTIIGSGNIIMNGDYAENFKLMPPATMNPNVDVTQTFQALSGTIALLSDMPSDYVKLTGDQTRNGTLILVSPDQPPTSSTTPVNGLPTLSVKGGKGSTSTRTSGLTQGGNGGVINIIGGDGGDISNVSSGGVRPGKGGNVIIQGGQGGVTVPGNTPTAGGVGGTAGIIGGTSNAALGIGMGGSASITGGANLGTGIGGNVYINAGYGNNNSVTPNPATDGTVFINTSINGGFGNVVINSTTDDRQNRLQVTGNTVINGRFSLNGQSTIKDGGYTTSIGAGSIYTVKDGTNMSVEIAPESISLSNANSPTIGAAILKVNNIVGQKTFQFPNISTTGATLAVQSDITDYANSLITIDNTSTPYTTSTLNTTYPTSPIRFKVVCPNLGMTYEKFNVNSWFSTNITVLP